MASQKSSALAAVVVLLLFCQTISASPHGGRPSSASSSSSDTQQLLESKSRGGAAGPAEVLLVEDDSSAFSSSALPLTMESLENRLVAKQPPVRMLRSSGLPQQMFYEDEEASEAAPNAVRIANPSTEQEQQQLSRLLAQYFRLSNGGSGGNRLPRRVSSTSKRAGKKLFLKVFEEVEVLTNFFLL